MQKNEKDIIRLIKYLPVILVILISISFTVYLYTENIKRFNIENKLLEKRFIELNKDLVRFQIEKIKARILEEKKFTTKKLKNSLQNQVQNAYEITMSIYNNNPNLSLEKRKKLIKDALREIRFNEGRGYFFIYEKNGKNILHPLKPHLENKNLWNYQDKKGTYLLRQMNKILKEKDETFYSWYWTRSNDDEKEYEKIGFFKVFAPFDWFIGTGEYIVDFEENLKNNLSNEISDFRYKKDGYVFIIDDKDRYLSYYDKSIIGKTVYEKTFVEDVDSMMKKLKEAYSKGAFYISYYHKDKPTNHKRVFKTSYIDVIEDWKWIIGTGFFMDDFYLEIEMKKNELQISNEQSIKELILISLIMTLLLLLVFMYISYLLEKNFYQYKKEIQKQINENAQKDNVLAHQSKMAAMGEMIGNIAHQWRQPLSTVSTIVTGIKLQREMGVKDSDFEKKGLDTVNKHIQYLSDTIDDFRDFFKPQKDPKEFMIDDLISKLISLLDDQFRNKDIEIVIDSENIKLTSLENEVIQVLINVLNNARDELVKIDSEKYIFINCKKIEENIIIEIKDNALGIDEKIIDRIFEPYFTTKDSSVGTGIGLYMSEEIIVKHLNGTIKASNCEYNYNGRDYKGAIFTINLPIVFDKLKNI